MPRASEERYRSLYFSMNIPVALHEILYDQTDRAVDFVILEVNPAYELMVRLERERIIGRKASKIYGLEKPPYLEIYEQVVKSGQPITFEMFSPLIDRYLIAAVFSPWPGRFAIAFTDITKYKQTEDLLRESEAEYSTLVNQAKDGIAIIQQDGNLQFANQALAMMSGYLAQELPGKPFLDLLAPECRQMAIQRHKSYLAGEKVPSVYEAKLKGKNGITKEVEFSISVIRYAGNPALMAIARDITERKRMEEELQRIQKLESIGILAGGIAHDFNNLLTAIAGNISFSKMYVKAQRDAFESLTDAEAACQQAKNLTQQLLTFSKGGDPIKALASVSELVKDTVSLALCGSRVRYELSLPNDLWWADIDRGQVRQAISNLVINADEAMPEGGIVSISAENVLISQDNGLSLKPGRYVKLCVKDQGTGIKTEHLSKIFDPYFTTKENRSGLGLSVAYAIITKHGGYIGVESEVGQGTTFYIYLPASAREIFTVRKVVEEKPPCERRRILFMDDQKIIRDRVRRMLTHLKYEVEMASEGDEAIELFKKAYESNKPFDAVILDLTIPGGKGGKEVIQKLREIDPKVKAIVSSGYSNDPVMADYMHYGFSGVVVKPYDFDELSETLSRLIQTTP